MTAKGSPKRIRRRGDVDSFQGSFFGQKVSVSGKETIYLVLLMCFMAASGYIFYVFVTGIQTTFSMEHQAGNTVLQKMSDALTEQNYMMTLNDAQRHKLNMGVPESLRKKLHRDD